MEIIANGLISKAFKKTNFNNNFIFFASGVSNSRNENHLNFQREFNLLKETINKFKFKHIIYFSTCSLNDPEITKYKEHKKEIERYIIDNCVSYNIFRLPQVVGVVNNNTLISYLIRNIKYGKKILINSKTTRHLLDVEDLPRISKIILNKGLSNKITDIAPAYNIDVLSIVKFISFELKIDYKAKVVNDGFKQNILISPLEDFLGSDDRIFQKDYWKLVLKKYIKNIYKIV